MNPIASVFAGNSSGIPSHMDALNAFTNLGTNIMNQRYATKMYERQRRDALEFWGMQNAYNSPAEQMKRFKEAGLNPNLIYGQGNAGNAGGVPLPDVSPINFREPHFEGSGFKTNPLLDIADLRIKQAQANNLEAQTEEIRQSGLLRAYQAQRAGFDLNMEQNLSDVSADTRRERLRQLKVQTDVMIDSNARQAALASTSIQEAAERMLNMKEQRKAMPLERGRIVTDTARMREQISLMSKEGQLKEMDMRLREKGINPSDPLWARYVGMFLSDIYEGRVTAGDIGTGIWKWLFGK